MQLYYFGDNKDYVESMNQLVLLWENVFNHQTPFPNYLEFVRVGCEYISYSI